MHSRCGYGFENTRGQVNSTYMKSSWPRFDVKWPILFWGSCCIMNKAMPILSLTDSSCKCSDYICMYKCIYSAFVLCLHSKRQLFSEAHPMFWHFSSLSTVIRTRWHPERPAECSAAALLWAASRLVTQSHGQTEYHQRHPTDVWLQCCLSSTTATQGHGGWHGPNK